MISYVTSQQDVDQFLTSPSMNDQTGLTFAYATDPAILAKLVPAPLKVVAPVVVGYVVNMGKPSFGAPYLEQTLYTMVSYQDKMIGAYPFELMLSGHGAEAGLVAGREGASIPKKLADEITLTRADRSAHATVTRHGTQLVDLHWTAGDINEPSFMKQFAGMMQLNQEMPSNSFFLDYKIDQHDDGTNHFINTQLVAAQMKSVLDHAEPGKLELTLTSSEDDPLGELKVLKPLGAAWVHFKTQTMFNTIKVADVDSAAAAPYIITGRYDRGIVNSQATTF